MKPFILSDTNSIANNFISEIRDRNLQKDSMRFRHNMERLGEILAYELSKSLSYGEKVTQTPLGTCKIQLIKEDPVLITILRAGIPFYQGFLNYFDKAESGFIGAFRSGYDEKMSFEIQMGYTALGDLNNREIVLIDPMIATGKSLQMAIDRILKAGTPKVIHVVGLIASREGFNYLKQQIRIETKFWFCAIDEELNDKSYIVPGLGDAGDLSFGKKL